MISTGLVGRYIKGLQALKRTELIDVPENHPSWRYTNEGWHTLVRSMVGGKKAPQSDYLERHVPFIEAILADFHSGENANSFIPVTPSSPSNDVDVPKGDRGIGAVLHIKKFDPAWGSCDTQELAGLEFEYENTPLLVFILGGITMAEIRSIHHISKALKREVFIGSSHIIYPEKFVDEVVRLGEIIIPNVPFVLQSIEDFNIENCDQVRSERIRDDLVKSLPPVPKIRPKWYEDHIKITDVASAASTEFHARKSEITAPPSLPPRPIDLPQNLPQTIEENYSMLENDTKNMHDIIITRKAKSADTSGGLVTPHFADQPIDPSEGEQSDQLFCRVDGVISAQASFPHISVESNIRYPVEREADLVVHSPRDTMNIGLTDTQLVNQDDHLDLPKYPALSRRSSMSMVDDFISQHEKSDANSNSSQPNDSLVLKNSKRATVNSFDLRQLAIMIGAGSEATDLRPGDSNDIAAPIIAVASTNVFVLDQETQEADLEESPEMVPLAPPAKAKRPQSLYTQVPLNNLERSLMHGNISRSESMSGVASDRNRMQPKFRPEYSISNSSHRNDLDNSRNYRYSQRPNPMIVANPSPSNAGNHSTNLDARQRPNYRKPPQNYIGASDMGDRLYTQGNPSPYQVRNPGYTQRDMNITYRNQATAQISDRKNPRPERNTIPPGNFRMPPQAMNIRNVYQNIGQVPQRMFPIPEQNIIPPRNINQIHGQIPVRMFARPADLRRPTRNSPVSYIPPQETNILNSQNIGQTSYRIFSRAEQNLIPPGNYTNSYTRPQANNFRNTGSNQKIGQGPNMMISRPEQNMIPPRNFPISYMPPQASFQATGRFELPVRQQMSPTVTNSNGGIPDFRTNQNPTTQPRPHLPQGQQQVVDRSFQLSQRPHSVYFNSTNQGSQGNPRYPGYQRPRPNQ